MIYVLRMARPALTAVEVRQTREQLLDAAQELYEAAGLEAMSFRSIAKAAECSHSKPYSYFENKAALVDALRVRSYEWLRDLLVVASSEHENPLEALMGLAVAYVDAGRSRPRMYALLYAAEAGSVRETEPSLMRAKLDAIGVCESVIEAAAQAGFVTLRYDVATTAHLFWMAAHGLVSLDNGGFLVVGRTVEDLIVPLFDSVRIGALEEAPR